MRDDSTCMVCSKAIPDGHICLSCEGQNEMQTFRRKESSRAKRYFRIVDDCGWMYYIATDNDKMIAANIALLVPHVRSAAEISREEFEEAQT